MLSHIPASNTWSSESLIFPLIDILHKKQTQKKKNDNQKGFILPLWSYTFTSAACSLFDFLMQEIVNSTDLECSIDAVLI